MLNRRLQDVGSQFGEPVEPRMSFADFLLSDAPWPGDIVDAVNDRSRDTCRDIEFSQPEAFSTPANP